MSGKRGNSTIQDIARALEITPSTVSRALNDHPRISQKTKQAVAEMARKLNYRQNHLAAALRSGRSQTLGVIVPRANRSFFSAVVRGIEDYATQKGYAVLITQSHDEPEKEVKNLQTLMRSQVDGIIASVADQTETSTHFSDLIQQKVPLVLYDRVLPDLAVSTVVIDDFQGAYQATRHLIDQGYRRIAHIAGPMGWQIYQERLRGYQTALTEAGLELDPMLVAHGHSKLEEGYQHMARFWALSQRPDALFSASDYVAMGAIQYLRSQGCRIPHDLGISGFSNEPFTEFLDPGLTTVEQHPIEMGRTAAEVLLDQINSPDTDSYIPRKTVLKPSLIIRGSSLKPAVSP